MKTLARLEKQQWELCCDILDNLEIATEGMTFRQMAKISGLSVSTISAMFHRKRRRYQFRSLCLLTLAVGKELGVI